MLFACLALGLLSCRDTLQPQQPAPPASVEKQEASEPVNVLELTCTLSFANDEQGEISCGPAGEQSQQGVSWSVVLPVASEYARWLPFNLVKDTVTETWSFISSVQNLLGQPIGTLDGTTAVGTKVAITYGPVATSGSGVVSVTNADGVGHFTGPNQPYFNYPWVIAPQAISPSRTWNLHVPNTVTEVAMGIAISTDFPATQSVAITPPDSVPDWLHADSAISPATASYPSRHVKNVVLLMFDSSASLSDRQLSIAKVGGEVVGGVKVVSDNGLYVVRVNPGPSNDLFSMIDTLRSLPHVISATPENLFDDGLDYLKPSDDASLSTWQLDPDMTGAEANWALERIAAPMAWGCSIGSSSTRIGVVDAAFHSNVPDIAPAYISNTIAGAGRHGLGVASIIGAVGNNGLGMSGVMWKSNLRLYARDFDLHGQSGFSTSNDIARIAQAARDSVRVINLSGGATPETATDSAMRRVVMDVVQPMLNTLRQLASDGHVPLLVFSAGNHAFSRPEFHSDAFYNSYPVLADSLHCLPQCSDGYGTVDRLSGGSVVLMLLSHL